jgi:hypothetical protein
VTITRTMVGPMVKAKSRFFSFGSGWFALGIDSVRLPFFEQE